MKQIGPLNNWVGVREIDANTKIIFFNIYYNVHVIKKYNDEYSLRINMFPKLLQSSS